MNEHRREYMKKYLQEYYQRNKEFLSEQNKKWKDNNPEKDKESKAKYARNNLEKNRKSAMDSYKRRRNNPDFKIKLYEREKDWISNNPLGQKAHRIVLQAIKTGKIKKGKCALSDKTCSRVRIEAHHRDYRKPLQTDWLCSSHHKRVDLGLIKLTNKQLTIN